MIQTRHGVGAALLGLLLTAVAPMAQAQTATIYGSLGNFDVVNNTGQDACGFQLDLEGVPYNALTYTFSYTRYGAAVITPQTYASGPGMRITWKSSDCATVRTVAYARGSSFAGTCYGNADNGCEHFGASAPMTATSKATSRWLVRDPASAGGVIAYDPATTVPVPYYYIAPPVVANAAPVVVEVVEADPPEQPQLYGNATWLKVFVRQMPREVNLDELVTTNPIVVPMDPAQLEVNWQLMQADPLTGGGKRNRNRNQGGSTLDPTTRAVVRRMETYAYNGAYDPITHEALCADLLCKVPSAGEVGDFVSAQMTAVNVQGDFITVAKTGTGGGNVDSADKRVACGNKCVAPFAAGTQVTLTAKANSGSVFAGWTGACTGTALTCSVIVRGANTVGAVFNTQTAAAGGGGGGGGSGGGGGGGGGTTTPASSYALTVSLGNPGTVTSNPAGINCGTACAANFAANAVVTLTATPLPGLAFTGWSGACSTTVGPVCTLTMSKALSVKANFTR